MKKNSIYPVIIALISVTCWIAGCSLLPKRVEYFQDKVQKMPEATQAHKEIQKEAADFVAQKTKETVNAAIAEQSSTNVLEPAMEAEVVAESLSYSIGKPENEWRKTAEELSRKLDRMEARLEQRIESFREQNNENAGKKIEQTGAFSIGYFTQFIILAIVLFLGSIAIKIVGMFNPAVAVGSKVLGGGFFAVGRKAKELAVQVIRGGEKFKTELEKQLTDPETIDKVKEIFRTSQMTAQSPENQDIIKELTKKV